MAQTDQHAWTIPEEGDDDYKRKFDSFFNELDGDVEIRDTDANKSNYDPKDGAKFVATDTQTVYLGDGSSWNSVELSGNSTSYTSLTVTSDLAIPTYSDDTNAPNETEYFNDSDSQLKYKDSNGTVHTATGEKKTYIWGPQDSELADGYAIRNAVPIPDGKTLEILNWGAITDANTSPTGLTVELQDESGTTIQSDNGFASGSPLYTETNSSGSVTWYRLAVVNATGTNYVDGNSPDSVYGQVKFRY